MIKKIDALGNITEYEYDEAGRNTKIIDALKNETKFEYDKAGRHIKTIDALGCETIFEYDSYGRKTKVIYMDGTSMEVAYDLLGRKISETDQEGNTTKFEYNSNGKPIKVVDALGNTTLFSYDELGNQISQKDANGNTTKFEYDKLGRLVKRILPLGMEETYAYNPDGLLISHTDFNGNTVTFEYDVNGNVIKKNYPDNTTVYYTYYATGAVKTEMDSRGTTKYKYDECNRLIEQENPEGIIISYTYDKAGNRTSVTVPSGTTTYKYDKMNRILSVTDPVGNVTDYSYDAVGNRSGVSYLNGTSVQYTYDKLHRLIKLVNSKGGDILSSYEYTLGLTGNRLKVVENDGRIVEYDYDATYKLIKETVIASAGSKKETIYTYDAVGNRLSKDDGHEEIKYTYDKNDRILSDGVNTYSYDKNGNTTLRESSLETVSYTYNYDNRLIKAVTSNSKGIETIEYVYDNSGTRMRKIINGSGIINFVVDKNRQYSQVLEERDGSGDLIVSYVYGDELISQNRNNQIRFYHYDGSGSTRVLTDSSGEVTDTYVYDAFGVEIYRTGTTLNDYLYTGQEYDANIGFYYLRARYMDCKTGRFINMDTYWGSNYDPVSLHKYLYANANPVMNYDPTGNFSLGHVLVGIAISSVLSGLVSGIFSFIRTGSFQEALWTGVKSMLITATISLLLLKFPVLLPFVMVLGIGSLIYQAATGQFDGLSAAELVTHIIVQAVFWLTFKTYVSTPSNEMVDVTRWGRPGLKPGDWVMPGGKTWWNYIRSFKWQPGAGNQFAPKGSGEVFRVPIDTIQWPSGWGIDGWWKGLYGQRIYSPGGGMSTSIFDVLMGGSIFSSMLEDFTWSEDENDNDSLEGE